MLQCDAGGSLCYGKPVVPIVELLCDVDWLLVLQLWRNAYLGLFCGTEQKTKRDITICFSKCLQRGTEVCKCEESRHIMSYFSCFHLHVYLHFFHKTFKRPKKDVINTR